jgi:subtilase family serine protease
VIPLLAGLLALQPAYSQTIPSDAAPSDMPAVDEGEVDPNQAADLTIFLKASNEAALDQAAEDLSDPASPNYEKWMTDDDLRKFAPTKDQIAKVTAELQKQGLTVEADDKLGFTLEARGTMRAAQRAFQTAVHQFSAQGKSFTAPLGAPRLTGGADQFVAAVAGIQNGRIRTLLKRPTDPRTGQPIAGIPLSKVLASSGGLSDFITNDCFSAPTFHVYKTPGQKKPIGLFYGNTYNAEYPNKFCGFTVAQLTDHYSLTPAYQKGLRGEGQTIVIVDPFGYPDVLNDVNIFSKLNGIPLLDSSNFEIVYPDGPPRDPQAGVKSGWDAEIALDVQWAHAIAPKAKIVLAASLDETHYSLLRAEEYVVNNHLGNVVSNSWNESQEGAQGIGYDGTAWSDIFLRGYLKGMSIHFASGDDQGYSDPSNLLMRGNVSAPIPEGHVVAVGGTSIIKYEGKGSVETGWGNYRSRLASDGLLDPPIERAAFGSGGGETLYSDFKPDWEHRLRGLGALLPHISVLGDPYTGVPIVLTENGTTTIRIVGGTGLSCALFSGIWALANQNAGHSLGEATYHLYRMDNQAIRDIVSVIGSGLPTEHNVAGVILESDSKKTLSPEEIFPPFGPNYCCGNFLKPGRFFSAIWPVDNKNADAISFGVDLPLTVEPGWDNVTGFGVPRGLEFIEAANN